MSNGKKLGVKSKVSDNYLVTGNDYEKFQEALHDMDNRTVIIPVRNPESMRIHCVIAKSDKEHASPRFVVLDPMEMKDSILLSDESIFSAEKCNIGRYKPTSEVFLSLQNQIKEIEQIGFFLTVHDQKKIIVTPSKKISYGLMSALGNRDIGERNEHFCVLLFSVPLRSGKRVYYHWAEGRKGQFLGERISCSFYQICVYSTALYFERASEFSGKS